MRDHDADAGPSSRNVDAPTGGSRPPPSGPLPPRRLRVLHVINSFESGGAEAMLCNLLLRTDRRRFEPSVVALIDDLSVAGPLLSAGIPLVTMGMRPGIPDP